MSPTVVRVVASFCALALAGCAGPDVPSKSTDTIVQEAAPAAEAEKAIRAAMTSDSIPGMSVAVMRDGALVWSTAFGDASLEADEPATRRTKFRLGSVSKLFAADLAAILAREGALDLDADIRTYIPQFPDKGQTITTRLLLGHLGGVRHYLPKDMDRAQPGGAIDDRLYPDAASILAIFADHPLVGAPGEKFVYSTYGFSLVGLVIEAATGRNYWDLVVEKILAPAGISDVVLDDEFAIVENRAEFYDRIEDYDGELSAEKYGPVVNARHLNSGYKIPSGGLAGTAEAVAAFGQLHVAPGPLSGDVYPELFRIQTPATGESRVGLSWFMGTDDKGRRFYEHSGSQQGGRAHLAVYPDDNLVVALATNLGSRPQDIYSLSKTVASAFLDGAGREPMN